MEPRLDRRHRPPEARGEGLAARTAVIGEQHERAFLLVQGLKAVDERCKPLRPVPRGERVDLVRGRLEALGQIFERARTNPPDLVERAIAGDGRHPRQRGALGRVELTGLFPDAHIGLLKRVGGCISSREDTGDDPVEFGAGLLVERRKRRGVTRRRAAQEIGETIRGRSRRSPARRLSPDCHSAILARRMTGATGAPLARDARRKGGR